MNKKLYNVMNWPEIEGIVYADCKNPMNMLGSHLIKEGNLIQIYRPDAVSVSIKVDTKTYELEKVDESGFFACLVPSRKKKLDYLVTLEDVKGKTITFKDAYSFDLKPKNDEFKNFFAGHEYDANKIFGSKEISIDGVSGTLFTIWAPQVSRVSVVGDFNKWNGKIHQMEEIDDRGIYRLFIPGVCKGDKYLYELKVRGEKEYYKIDPYATEFTKGKENYSVVGSPLKKTAKKLKIKQTTSPRIYELNLLEWSKKSGIKTYAKLAEDIANYLSKLGFDYVNLMPVAEYFNEDTYGYTTIGMFAPTKRFGNPDDFVEFIDILHNKNIGVIIDFNCAYFGTDTRGLHNFNKTNLYGGLSPILEKNETWNVYTYDYYNNCVLSFLYSSFNYWVGNFGIDGIRIDSLASMLYLDYGKEPGSWIPNMYGGNENLAAIEFIKNLNKMAAKENVITIAEESSGWIGITKDFDGDNLGFDYVLNKNWTNDYLEFMEQDPLFRKGLYDNLILPMVYNYNERFIQKFSADDLYGTGVSLYSLAAGNDAVKKKSDVRLALAYLYLYPGAKMITFGQELGLDLTNPALKWDASDEDIAFIKDLNHFITSNSEVFDQDTKEDGFRWVEDCNSEETILGFVRIGKNGQTLTAVFNFTPVERVKYRLHVLEAGKYSMIFNTNEEKYGGDEKLTKEIFKSDKNDENPKELDYIDIDIPGLSMLVFSCEKYTEREIEENRILKEAAVAKKNAEDKVKVAKELATKAKEEAIAALEAQKRAEEAAKLALEAKNEAQKKADDAVREAIRIDEETKVLLEELKNKVFKKDTKKATRK